MRSPPDVRCILCLALSLVAVECATPIEIPAADSNPSGQIQDSGSQMDTSRVDSLPPPPGDGGLDGIAGGDGLESDMTTDVLADAPSDVLADGIPDTVPSDSEADVNADSGSGG